ncbi:transposase [Acinetobacter soli]|uniref:transposase n=1 Tax=Acinetobacter soli TaxID=487316 RepID=UPI003AAABE23
MIGYQKSSDGIHLLVDHTALRFLGEGGKTKEISTGIPPQRCKLYIGINAETLQIRAVHLTTNNVSDAQVLSDLLNQISQDEKFHSVCSDGAYDTTQCRQVTAYRQAHVMIPPRKNEKPWKYTKFN